MNLFSQRRYRGTLNGFRLGLVCLGGAFLWADIGFGQGLVNPRERRLELLEKLERIVYPGEWQMDASAWPDSPFHSVVAAPVEGEVGTTEAPPAPPPPPRLSDREALEIIAQEFRPTGAIILGLNQSVQFKSGQMMRVGESFRGHLRNEIYVVTLTRVTLRNYTLKLGDAELVRSFESSNRPAQ